MAGWTNSTGTGTGGGRGSGGRGFTNRLYTNNPIDMIHGGNGGGGGGGGSGRFIGGGRSRGRPPQQPHYRYRRVDAVHRDFPPPASLSDQQAASSTSSRHARLTHPIPTSDKSSASGTAAPPSTREPDDKAIRSAANFECNVCFDMAAEPVVTKCGHLFCWECLYQWLHVHSHHRECPVCKGQVADDAIIPIYGRGGSAATVDNAPPRPTGARVESSRQRQQQQQSTSMHHALFEFPPIRRPGAAFREAVLSIISPRLEDTEMDNSDAMTYFDDGEFYPGVSELDMEVDRYGDFDDELYEYDDDDGSVLFPLFPSAGTEASNPSSSQAHADIINIRDNTIGGYHQVFGYSGASPNNNSNRGRRGRCNRTRVSADHLSTDEMVMVMPSSSGFIHNNNGGSTNGSTDAAFRPNGGWTERRGRSNRNSNSGVGRGGMQDRRRQRTNYY